MEQDRYQQNHALYILGMGCLMLSIALILFTLYIAPALLFDWKYDIPFFIHNLKEWVRYNFDVSNSTVKFIVLMNFVIPCIIFSLFAYYASKRIDNDIYGIEKPANEEHEESSLYNRTRSDITLGLKILTLMVIVVIIALFAEFLVHMDPMIDK
jgi:hypothetical protein